MIRTEPLVGIAMTSFGSIVGRTVRKEPLVNQIEDSGGIVIPFTIASGADSGGACTAVIVSSEDDEALGREPLPPELEHPPTTSATRRTIGSRIERAPCPAISTGSDLFWNPSSSSSTYRRFPFKRGVHRERAEHELSFTPAGGVRSSSTGPGVIIMTGRP